MAMLPADQLKRRLTAIRATRHQAAAVLDDYAYRQLLQRVAGVSSSTEIRRLSQADAVLQELDRLGLTKPRRQASAKKPANEWAFAFSMPADKQALCKKIYRCAQKIGALQQPPVKVMPKKWVEGAIRQATGHNIPGSVAKVATPLETCSVAHLQLLVQILESWAKKLESAR